MIWQAKNWSDVSRDDLHALLRLRTDVFVVEQDCPYPELDGKDLASVHVWAAAADAVPGAAAAACARVVMPADAAVSIGRVAVGEGFRGTGLGQTLMLHTLHATTSAAGRTPIRISAQSHLQDFYAHFGFVARGDEYLEDGIPHREMWRDGDPLLAWGVALRHATARVLDVPVVPSTDGAWGTGETLRHLVLVTGGVGGALAAQRPSERGKPLSAAHRAAAGKLIGAMASPRKFVVPAGLALPAVGDVAEADREALGRAVEGCLAGMSGWGEADWARTAFRHPAAGWMGGEDVLAFLTFHMLHHRRILERMAFARND